MSNRLRAMAGLFLALTGTALAQEPARVRDINTTLTGGTWEWSSRTGFVEMGGLAYFQVSDGIHGNELWRSDGTAAGTSLVRDICPGACSSLPRDLTVVGSWIYFSADDGAHGHELWRSDGTEAGTMLVKDVIPGLVSPYPHYLFELNGTILFAAGIRELWRSDGTEAGTTLLKSFEGLNNHRPVLLARAGGVVFLNGEDADHGSELWKTDGTPEGTVLVKDINPGFEGGLSPSGIGLPGFSDFAALGNRLFFVASDGITGRELWVSDGTEAGTTLVKDIIPGTWASGPCCLTELNGQILFSSDGDLWKTDGTEINTVQVKEIPPPPFGTPRVQGLTVAGPWVYFLAVDDTHGMEIWKTDGTGENTVLVKDIQPGAGSSRPYSLKPSGSTLFFFADDGTSGLEPWKSDGTEAGTVRLADLNPGTADSHALTAFGFEERETVAGGRWFFRALEESGNVEVYTSDGTPAGTQRLKEVNSQTSAFLPMFFHLHTLFGVSLGDRSGTLFFGAMDGPSGLELWQSDGTEAGTAPVAPGSGASDPQEITALGNSVLFSALGASSFGPELWISDGPAAGTTLLKDLDPDPDLGGFAQGLTLLNGRVFLQSYDASGAKLWKSDGTPEGTVEIGPTSATELMPAGSFLFYNGHGNGGELWRTDGTPEGTVQLLSSGFPERLTRSGNRMFFSAGDLVSGRSLWVSDGTIPGTHPVETFTPGSGILMRNYGPWPPFLWVTTGSRLLFAAVEPATGEELWVSDGTEAGTFQVLDILPGSRSSEIHWLTAVGDKVYFVADDGTHGRELWVTDGTPLGTFLLADLVSGAGSSLPEQLKAVGRNLVFSAHTPDHGREPWLTDGTPEGTRRIADIAPGPLPSTPIRFTFSGPWLYFVANDGETGFELYSVPWTALDGGADFHTVTPCRLADTRQEGGKISGSRTFEIAGLCGVPETARSLAVNVTAVDPTGHGSLLLHQTGIEPPAASTLSFAPGRIRNNNAVVHLGDGAFAAVVSQGQEVHLIVDVSGYYE
ncbi:MAG TPA: ELWxxDGT repeat protein [Thermoanaerobaculia bacterium]|nr:ELWxxDGT repeat protein [Thermoanaerobaculia bacterium]